MKSMKIALFAVAIFASASAFTGKKVGPPAKWLDGSTYRDIEANYSCTGQAGTCTYDSELVPVEPGVYNPPPPAK